MDYAFLCVNGVGWCYIFFLLGDIRGMQRAIKMLEELRGGD